MKLTVATLVIAAGLLAACSSGSQASQGGAVAGSTAAPTTAASAASGGSGATVEAKTAGSKGTVLVAGSHGMTVYTFGKDVANSGKSGCSGGCLAKWPALTVPAGTTPSAGSGVSGKLGTITRDDGTLQATYNGLPLYFFANDKAPGDTNGDYTGWNLVKP
ncbi:MAG: COG4315 family predicted lipoprotein [Candidatus Limnocylindrales bacterium]